MKKNLLILGLAVIVITGLLGFTQYEGDEKSFCTVRVYISGTPKEKGIFVYKSNEEVRKVEINTIGLHDRDKLVHQTLSSLRKENWHLVSSHTMGFVYEYNLEK